MANDNYDYYSNEELLEAISKAKPTDDTSTVPKSDKPSMPPMSIGAMARDFAGGIIEAPYSMFTGIGRTIGGGLKGYGSLFSSYNANLPPQKRLDIAADTIQNEMAKTYHPTTATGQFINEAVAWPFKEGSEKLGMLGKWIGEKIPDRKGGNFGVEGESIGQVALPIAGTLYGANAALKSAGNFPAVRKKLVIDDLKNPNYLNTVIKKKGNDIGLIAPAESRISATISNLGKVNDHLSLKNSQVATARLAKQVGIKNKIISDLDVARRRAELSKDYGKVEAALPKEIIITPSFKVQINQLLEPIRNQVKSDPLTFAAQGRSLKLLEQQLKNNTIPREIILKKIEQLRSDASVYNKNIAGNPAEIHLANTSYKLANMYEDLIEANLANKGMLFDNFHKARTQLSQIHIIEQARKADGIVDLHKLKTTVGQYAADKKMVTGDLKTITDFTSLYGRATRPINEASFNTPSNFELAMDYGAITVAPHTGGASLALTLPTLARATAPFLAKRGMLQSKPRSYMTQALISSAKQGARGASPILGVTTDATTGNNVKSVIDKSQYSDEELLNYLDSLEQ